MRVSGATHDEITWINHAGYQLESGQVRLVCDPWLSGPAFDRGWDLLAPTCFSASDLGNATHIWFSHEHPDHFSPADIKRIDPSRRSQITVLFQRTRDRRVASFCAGLGFNVRELDAGAHFDLAPGVRGVIGIVGADSWLYLETPSCTYLNMNDCILNSDRQFDEVRRALSRPLDVLFVQFSYANWAGNRGDIQAMRSQAAEKISQIQRLVAHTGPRFLIPFASFVFFSNTENFYLNEGGNTIDDVFSKFDAPERPCIVLYPGDVWTPGSPHDSPPRVARYMAERAAIAPRHSPRPMTLEALQDLAAEAAGRLTKRNQLWSVRLLEWAGVLAPLTVHLDDLDTTVVYRPGRRLEVVTSALPDVSCSADAFAQCLRVDYGGDTLLVNGRFQVRHPDGQTRLRKAFGINRYNNQGMSFPWDYISTHVNRLGMPRFRRA